MPVCSITIHPSAKHALECGSAPDCHEGNWAAPCGWAVAMGAAPGMLEGAAVRLCLCGWRQSWRAVIMLFPVFSGCSW